MQEAEKKTCSAQQLALLLSVLLVACEPSAVAESDSQSPTESPAESPGTASGCGENGGLQATFTGGIDAELNWSGSAVNCENMLRPNGEGARLRFSGTVAGERLAIILAMPDLQPGQSNAELPSTVTITVEGSGRFFSTPSLNACWTDLASQQPLPGNGNRYAIKGALYCIAPLGELNGGSAISIAALSFDSTIDWETR